MDVQCIIGNANSNYTVKTPKDEVYILEFSQKIENLDTFSSKERFRDQTGGWETTSQNGSPRSKREGSNI